MGRRSKSLATLMDYASPWATPVVSSLSDVSSLIAQLGGNAITPAFYDRRVNVTSASNNVSAWADARTVGAGPSLGVGTGTAPTISGARSALTFAAAGAVLFSAGALAVFNDAGPASFIYVGHCSAASLIIAGVATSSPSLAIAMSTSKYASATSNTDALTVSNVTGSGTTIVAIADINSAGTTGRITVPNQAAVSTSALTTTPTNGAMVVGAGNSGANASIAQVVSACFLTNQILTAAQVTAIINWAVANHGAVAQ